jgi:undecaprenyl-diphosphatase
MFLQRPHVANFLLRTNSWVESICRKVTPAGYLALHLVAGAFFIIAFTWCFGAISSNATNHHYLLTADHNILSWFQEHSTRPLVSFARKVSYFGSSTFLTIASIALGLFLLWRRLRYRLLLLLVAMLGGAVLSMFLRTSHWSLPLLENSPFEQFPSWHAMGSTLFYGLLTTLVGSSLIALRWRALTFLFACVIILLITLTRIYLGAHYVTDVVGAIAAGLAWLIWCQLGIMLMRHATLISTKPSSSS